MNHFSNPLTALLPSPLPSIDLGASTAGAASEGDSKSNFISLLESIVLTPETAKSLSECFLTQQADFHEYHHFHRLSFRLLRFLEKFFTSRMTVSFATSSALKLDPLAKILSMKELCDSEIRAKMIDKLYDLLQ